MKQAYEFTIGQKVWAAIDKEIRVGTVALIEGAYTTAKFPIDGSPCNVVCRVQSWPHTFFRSEREALEMLASIAEDEAGKLKVMASKWLSIRAESIARAASLPYDPTPTPDVIEPADPKELQNDGDPIRGASMAPMRMYL